ncbi:MAG TPA: methylmalonyl Co-A mutase-associated GTPase MeaB, partial [Jatrophihabitans sp.]|nr:methylmalonyl Co-A mutase-associated GTPase MeaB [Jatrophihabitans sp.]
MAGQDDDSLIDGVRAGDRAAVARTITLVESRKPEHRERAQRVLARLLPDTGRAERIGISGVPGVGKSTFIDAFGTFLIGRGHRVAVLAVDPSSARTGGSILGDKTRMARLAVAEHAFVRPSPSAGTLGGVAEATRETMLVMEAAGYDVVLVETVGVGQSEFVVAGMVDTFLFLTLARTGDSLQGMKRGILELADVIAVNKADGDRVDEAERAARELSAALRLLREPESGWQPPVLTCSALTEHGIDRVYKHIQRHRQRLVEDDGLARKRSEQLVQWTRDLVRNRLLDQLRSPYARPVVAAAE